MEWGGAVVLSAQCSFKSLTLSRLPFPLGRLRGQTCFQAFPWRDEELEWRDEELDRLELRVVRTAAGGRNDSRSLD